MKLNKISITILIITGVLSGLMSMASYSMKDIIYVMSTGVGFMVISILITKFIKFLRP